MLIYQDSTYRGSVRLHPSPLGNFELVSPEGKLVVIGDTGAELVDLVELTPELRWEDQREVTNE